MGTRKDKSVKKDKPKIVEVWLTQEVKLSKNYNSASASVGMRASTNGRPNEAMAVLKRRVEEELKKQVKELADFLDAASGE